MRHLFAAPVAVIAFLVAASPAVAGPVQHLTVNQRIPLAGFQADVPCTGDTITFTQGFLHDKFFLTQNANRFSITLHDQPQNAKGTDTSGRSYEGIGVSSTHLSGSLTGNQQETTSINVFDMIGKGGAPNLKVHETIHITFTPDGTVTAAHDRLRVTCG